MLRGQNLAEDISIHAPRVGSDPSQISASYLVYGFQSTLPVWGATRLAGCSMPPAEFQSTLPVWGATFGLMSSGTSGFNFNPRSPCGERRTTGICGTCIFYFNPRSPCGERQDPTKQNIWRKLFQSTLPVWGATGRKADGRDDLRDFNPRSPCGERRGFDDTHLRRDGISIHAPRVGSDMRRRLQ